MRDRLDYFRTLPDRQGWLFCAATFPLWAGASLLFAHTSGFLGLRSEPYSLRELILGLVTYFLAPALLEESLFRAAFYPPGLSFRQARTWIWLAVNSIVFVGVHPFSAWLAAPENLSVFGDGRFLILVLVLGLYCSILLIRTGSIWPPVLVHYVLVIAWQFVFWGSPAFAG